VTTETDAELAPAMDLSADEYAARLARNEAFVEGLVAGLNATAADHVVLEEPREGKIPRFGDPRQAAVDIVRERLDRVLQPVDEDEVWHGVNVVTRKDLNEVLALDLPPASIFAASVRTPAFVYVDAICPVCGIAGEITVELGVKLIAVQSSRKLQLTAKASPLPHQCGQMRIRDVTPTYPVANGQLTMDQVADVLQDEEAVDVDSDDGTSSQDDDVDLRPQGEVNPDELQGAAARDVQEAERATDGDDLLPF